MVKESTYERKNLFVLISLISFGSLTIIEASISDSISYNKAWSAVKDNCVLVVVTCVLAPCFKNIFLSVADDSVYTFVFACLAIYTLSYDYESVLRKPEKEPLGRPLIRDTGIPTFVINIMTVLLCSRLPNLFQSACLMIINLW